MDVVGTRRVRRKNKPDQVLTEDGWVDEPEAVGDTVASYHDVAFDLASRSVADPTDEEE